MKANKKMIFRRKLVAVAVASCFTITPAFANPIGATVVNGQVGFATQGSTLTVTNSPNSIINWQQFSINTGETTRFIQQSVQSAVLNRVVGQDPSQLLGSLLSNGRVYLINPNGILFGQGAVIDVGGLVASTLKLSDGDFLAGRLNFTGGVGAGSINNQGSITTPTGGNVYLIAPDITNSGVITSPQGEILLAAGHTVNLMDTTNPNVQVTVGAPDTQAVNIGSLIARSGKVGIYGALINQQGLVNADTAVVGANGKITLKANQRVDAGGTISAQGAGGGTINVMADMQSGTVNVTGTLDASAPNSGNGGFIETSAAHVQVADTAHVTTLAAHGNIGTWLIDPNNFTISASGDMTGAAVSSTLGSTNLVIQTTTMGTLGGNGDIFVYDNITKTANTGGTTTLTLQAENSIIVEPTVSISSTVGALNVVFNADSDGLNGGNIQMMSGSSIVTNGGNITLGGGTPLLGLPSGAAVGIGTLTSADASGIYLDGATLNAGGGNISMVGTGAAGTTFGADGIYATDTTIGSIQPTVIRTAGAGTITMNGTGGAGLTYNSGVRLGLSTQVSTVDGAISITGQGGNGSDHNIGVYVHDNATITATGAGDIILNGTGGAGTYRDYGVRLSSSAQITTNTGDISITGQGAGGGSSNYAIIHTDTSGPITSTAGNILLTGLGAGDAGTISLSGAINAVSGDINVSGVNLNIITGSNSPITITAGNDFIANLTGAMTVQAANNSAVNGQTLDSTVTLHAGRDITVNAATGITIAVGNATAVASGSGTKTTSATADANVSAGRDISLTTSGGNINVSGGNASAAAGLQVYNNSGSSISPNIISAHNTATAHAATSVSAGRDMTLTVTTGDINVSGGLAVANAGNMIAASSDWTAQYNIIAANNTANATAGVSLTATGNQALTVTTGNISVNGGDAKVLAGNLINASSAWVNNNTITGSNSAAATASSILSAGGSQSLIVTNGNINIAAGQANAGQYFSGVLGFGAGNGVRSRGSYGSANSNNIGTSDTAANNHATATATLDLSAGATITISTVSGNINVGGGAVTAYGVQGVRASSSASAVGNSVRGNNTAIANGHLAIAATGDVSITAGTAGSGNLNIYGTYASASASKYVSGSNHSVSGNETAEAASTLSITGANVGLSAANSINISASWASASAYKYVSGSNHTVSGNETAEAASTLSITGANIVLSAANSISISAARTSATAYKDASGIHNMVSGDASATAMASVTIVGTGDVNITAGTAGSGNLYIYGSGTSIDARAYKQVTGSNFSGSYILNHTVSGNETAEAASTLSITGANITLAAANNINIKAGSSSNSVRANANKSVSGIYNVVSGNTHATTTESIIISGTGDVSITAGTAGSGNLSIYGGSSASIYARAFKNVSGSSHTVSGNETAEATGTLSIAGASLTLAAANNVNISASSASAGARAYKYVNGSNNIVSGDASATAMAGITIAATGGDLSVTAVTGSLYISGGGAYADAYKDAYGNNNTLSGSQTATATDTLNLTATGGITLAATTGGVSISASSARAYAYQNVYGNNHDLSGNQAATATSTLNIAAGGDLSINAGGGSLDIYASSARASAYQYVGWGANNNNTLSGNQTATATNTLRLSGRNIMLSGNNGVSIYADSASASAYKYVDGSGTGNNLSGNQSASATSALTIAATAGDLSVTAVTGSLYISGSSASAEAYKTTYGNSNTLSGSETATATSTLNIAAGGDLSVTAGGGGLYIYGSSASASAYQYVGWGANNNNTLSGNQTATATNTLRLSGRNIMLSGNNGVSIYADSASASAYKYVGGSGSGNNLSGNQGASATSALTIAANAGNLSVTAANGNLNINGSSASANAYKTTNGNSNTLSGSETAAAASTLSLTSTGGITLAATTGGVNIGASSARADAYQNVYGSSHTLSGNQAATATATLNIAAVGALGITAGSGGLNIYGDNAEGHAYQYVSGNSNSLSGAMTANAASNINLSGSTITIAAPGGISINAASFTRASAYSTNIGSGNILSGTHYANANAGITLSGNLTASSGSLNLNGGYADASGAGAIASNDLTLNTNMVSVVAGDLNLYGGNAYASGSGAVAHADAKIISTGDLNIDVAGNVYLQGGYASAYPGATASAVAFVGGYPQTVTITTGNDFTLYGSLPAGNGGTEYGYAGIVGLQAMTINVGNDFNLAGGLGTAYTDALWGAIGPGTGKWDTPFSPISLTVGGAVNNIDNISCPTCAPAFLQLLMSALPPAVLGAVGFGAHELPVPPPDPNKHFIEIPDVHIEPISFNNHEDKKNEKPVCR